MTKREDRTICSYSGCVLVQELPPLLTSLTCQLLGAALTGCVATGSDSDYLLSHVVQEEEYTIERLLAFRRFPCAILTGLTLASDSRRNISGFSRLIFPPLQAPFSVSGRWADAKEVGAKGRKFQVLIWNYGVQRLTEA